MRQLAALLVLFALAISSLPLPLAAEELLIEEEVVVTPEVEEKSPDEFVPIESPIPEVLEEVQGEEKSQLESTPDDECVPKNTECVDTTGIEEPIPEPESFQTFFAPLVALVEEPGVSGTVLSASVPENWDPANWSSWDTIRVDIGKQQHLRDEGVVTHMTLMLRDTSNDPNRPVSFNFTGAFDRAYDCTTPFKTVAEWGIPSGLEYAEVTIGPFTGTQCDLRLRALPFFAGQFILAARKGNNTFDTKFAIPYPSAFIAYAAHIPGGTRITTDLTSNTIFKGKESYLISGKVTVEEGVTVTVEPGAVVKFDTRSSLEVNGTLIANGTLQNPVYFTSFKDDAAGGDLNGDGDASLPDLGDWESLTANFPAGNVFIENAIVRYGGTQMLSGAEGNFSVRNSSITNSNRGVWNYRSGSGSPLAFDNNWWGDSSGPQDGAQYQGGGTFIGPWIAASPWLTENPFLDPPCTENCASNVLFLPGFLGSRLYTEGGRKLWEPNGSDDFRDLAMDENGESILPVYVGDVVDRASPDGVPEGFFDTVYGELMEWLTSLVEAGSVQDWASYAYDWRYGVFDIIDDGALKEDGSREYLIPLVESLAENSKTKKVTIISHSNGGLLAKALMIRLAEKGMEDLVDQIIFVGTPQVGTPQGMLGLLHGHDIIRPFWTPQGTAREAAVTMPGAYSLLPSEAYFERVASPIAFFEPGVATDGYRDILGESITSFAIAVSFMLNAPVTRATPGLLDEETPYPLPESLLSRAGETHALLYAWTAPSGTMVHEIAGWGNKTVVRARYYTESSFSCPSLLSCGFHESIDYEPIVVEDGDSTVVTPSALFMDSGVYFDLAELTSQFSEDRKHNDLTESPRIHEYLEYLLGLRDSYDATLFVNEEPEGGDEDIIVSVHSPVILSVVDEQGRETGIFPLPGSDLYYISEDIPGSSVQFGGEGKYVYVPANEAYGISFAGIGSGTFSVKIQDTSNDEIVSTATITNLPVSKETLASMQIQDGLKGMSALTVDENGDGASDISIDFEINETIEYQSQGNDTQEINTEDDGPTSHSTNNNSKEGEENAAASLEGTLKISKIPPQGPPSDEQDRGALVFQQEAKAQSQDQGSDDAEEIEAESQTASVYNAFQAVVGWLKEVLNRILSWISHLIGGL